MKPPSGGDRRSGRVVFVSHCLLDQNARFPGIAVAPGCVSGIVRRLEDDGLGIEQLPCLEMKYWGGANRRLVMPFLRISSRMRAEWEARLFSDLVRVALWVYRLLCEYEAWRTARQIGGFRAQGYEVRGIVVMNDSPTCGLDRTIDLQEFVCEARARSVDWACPTLETMSSLLGGLLRQGSGAYVGALKRRMERSGTPVAFYGFDPWADADVESARLASRLGD